MGSLTPWHVILILVVLVVIGAVVAASSRPRKPGGRGGPIGHTTDGQPIYPVVGYTTDGKPITANNAVGVQPFNPRTNSMAIIALIMGFVFPLLAIPLGHISRSQIRQSGEQGGGMALAGLVLGYIALAALAVVVLVILSNS